MSDTLLDKARTRFSQDRFAADVTGITLTEASLPADGKGGYAACCLTLQDRHRNANGDVMGGVLFTLADYAFAVASNMAAVASASKLQWVSLHSSIHFLSAARGTTLTAVTHCLKQGHSTCLYAIAVSDDSGTLVAQVETTGMRTVPANTTSQRT